MKNYIIIILVLCGILLVGCDDRGSDNPEMTVTATGQFGNYVFNKRGYNEMEFVFQLEGPQSKIANQRISVDITNNMGNFLGSGSNNSVVTNERGRAEGTYIAGESGYGAANVLFVLETWPKEKDVFNIPIRDFPRLDTLSAGANTLPADGLSQTAITAQINCEDDNYEDIKVLFSSSHGAIADPVVQVDLFGFATTTFTAPLSSGTIAITAKLELDPGIYKRILIECETP